MKPITICLWFDKEAEAAAHYYTSIFENSKITHISRYGNEGQEIHGQQSGQVMAVEFELNGQNYVALNGGPLFKFSEAISLQIRCETQQEIDYYWDKLSEGGNPAAQQCGWLKDKFGLSWQVTPTVLFTLMSDPDKKKAEAVTKAMLQMKKFDIAALKRAHTK